MSTPADKGTSYVVVTIVVAIVVNFVLLAIAGSITAHFLLASIPGAGHSFSTITVTN